MTVPSQLPPKKKLRKLRKQVKAAHNQETFPRKMAKFRLWKNVEDHDRGPGKVMEFSNIIICYYIIVVFIIHIFP